MPTQYVTRQQLEAAYGSDFVAQAITDAGIELDAVLEAVHAEVDSYVGRQVQLPPSVEAVAQVRNAAMKLIAYQLYVQVPSEALTAGAAEARKFLENVAGGKVLLHTQTKSAEAEVGPCSSTRTRFVFGAAPRVLSARIRRSI